MKELKYFQSDDGKLFTTLEECENYEKQLLEREEQETKAFKERFRKAFPNFDLDEFGYYLIIYAVKAKKDYIYIYGTLNTIIDKFISHFSNLGAVIYNIEKIEFKKVDDENIF